MRIKRYAIPAVVLAFAAAATLPALAGADGKALYSSKCAMCHGADGVAKPMGKGSANFNTPAFQEANSVEAIVKVTKEGKGKMPKYDGKLTDEEIKAVADYIKTLAPAK